MRLAIEIVVPFTEWAVTEGVVLRAAAFTARLNASLMLVAVHAVPYPMSFGCPALVHAHLVDQLIDLASRCALPFNPQVVLARSCRVGFRHALKPESTVLLGTRETPLEDLRGTARHGAGPRRTSCKRWYMWSGKIRMLDLIFILISILFFAAAWMFVKGCDRL